MEHPVPDDLIIGKFHCSR